MTGRAARKELEIDERSLFIFQRICVNSGSEGRLSGDQVCQEVFHRLGQLRLVHFQ
jgi:hypothetical protein